MKKQDEKLVLWTAGIIILLLVITKLPLLPFFAIVSTTTCADGIENYYPFDGTFIDMKDGQDAINNGAIFIAGKLGSNALEFNGTNYISFPILNINHSTGFWLNNYSNEVGWTYLIYEDTSILSSTFMLGLNGSVDELVVGTDISNLSNIQPCYTVSYEENITCQEYYLSQVTDVEDKCLNYSGDYFPSCQYSLLDEAGYYVSGDNCLKRFLCEDIQTNDYSTRQECEDSLIEEPEPSPSPSPSPTPPEETITDKLNKGLFEIAGFEITLLHLFVALIIIMSLLFFLRK